MIDSIMEHVSARAMATIAPGATAEEAIRGAFQAYWDHVIAEPEEHLLTYELTQYALRTPGFDAIARRQYGRYVGAILTFLDQLTTSLDVELRTPARRAGPVRRLAPRRPHVELPAARRHRRCAGRARHRRRPRDHPHHRPGLGALDHASVVGAEDLLVPVDDRAGDHAAAVGQQEHDERRRSRPGLPSRPIGRVAAACSASRRRRRGSARWMASSPSVSVQPMLTPLIRIRSQRWACAALRVSPTRPALAATYGAR